ncbi:MAG: hypothetical protein A2428_06935 [Bdellovibrionales bacterium RIFOXYC1_FULL_54_43]|nr:MAG: hypothetical protein A2428_06935 [Bdellovibrionales bacterium RIFOXYC1_FULL_54_43]OFZ81167.1 MAG: hypothetical protein A2603_06900 [Bdellovibrionales bacterium RIFOXYD1_FULL_55_31]
MGWKDIFISNWVDTFSGNKDRKRIEDLMKVLDFFSGNFWRLRALGLRLIRVTGKGDDLWISMVKHLLMKQFAHPNIAGSAAPSYT